MGLYIATIWKMEHRNRRMYRTLEIDFVLLVIEFVQLRETASEKHWETGRPVGFGRIRQLETEQGTIREVTGSIQTLTKQCWMPGNSGINCLRHIHTSPPPLLDRTDLEQTSRADK
jgi:hypothetical protein